MSENTKEEEKKEPQQGGAAKTTPPPTTSSEDVFQIAVKAEKLLKEIMSSSASSSSLSLLVKQEPSEPSSSAASNTVNTTTATVNSPQPVNLQMSASTPSFGGFHGSTAAAASNPYYVQQHQLHPTQPYYHHPTVLAQSQNNILVTTPQPSASPGGYYINQPQFFMPTATTPQIVYHPNGGQTIVHHPIYYHPPQTGYFHGVAPPIRPPIVPSHSYQYLGRATTSIGPPPIRQHYNPHQPPPNPYQRPPPNGNSIENGAVYYRKRRFDDNFGSGHQANSDNYPPIKRYSSGGFEQRSTLFRTSSAAASLGENGRQNSCDTATTETITTTNSRENEPSNKDNNNNDDDEDDDDNDDDEILDGSVVAAANMASDDDLNLVKERELSELKSKPVAEKLNVFLKYYRQFAHSYEQRIHALSDSCTDSLKMQFHALAKHLAEYDGLLGELHAIVVEHEREHVCKNNHRKTKKLFNKSKAFIRYDCSKRLESSIFDYRRLISSQDPYAGMYDLIDMNNHLVNMLPDIGVSIRRYINRCERARSQEEEEDEANNDDYANWHSENSNDSVQNSKSAGNNESNVGATSSNGDGGGDLLQIPTFNEYIANMNSANDPLNEPMVTPSMSTGSGSAGSRRGQPIRSYESFSKGIDALNRYLLNRIENEPTVDELVQERIIKWINKRQAKYILIFSDVDKLLNQHSAGTDCYPKFHSYLLFNLGKLITVCDSYHQKLKELLYSTTIRRKKKRKKVKLLPEAMSDVFNEIGELKRALDNMKYSIKRCNEAKTAAAKHAAIVMNSTANEPPPI